MDALDDVGDLLNERAYRRALALAHASGLDWAAWALGLTAPCKCSLHDFFGLTWVRENGVYTCRKCDAEPLLQPIPASIEDLHAPYREDCKRRGVAPGPLPSLLFRSPQCWWDVYDDGYAAIQPGTLHVQINSSGKKQISSKCYFKIYSLLKVSLTPQ